MNKKLIVGITSSGSTNLLKGQLAWFIGFNYDTWLLAPDDEKSRKFCLEEGCKLLPVKAEREISLLSDTLTLVKVVRHFLRIKPDIVNSGTPKMGFLAMIAAKLCGVRSRIYTCRGLRYEHEKGFRRHLLKLTERITGACATKIVCISNSVRELALQDKLFGTQKCIVINKGSSNGINLNYFNKKNVSLAEILNLKAKLKITDRFIYGFIGRLVDRKGINELYQAFTSVFSRDKNSVLLILGLPEYSQIADKSIIDMFKTHPGITWPGRDDNVPLYLSVMDVLVLPAWWEGFGNVLLEAAAMGIPVISTNGTGTKDAVLNGYNGILVDVKNVTQLTEAMEALKRDDNIRESMGKNGRDWCKNFDNHIIWSGLEKIYCSQD